MNRLKKFMQEVKEPEKSAKLLKWQGKLEVAKRSYENDLKLMEQNESLYNGDRAVMGNPNKNAPSKKLATNVRNITYELIESQVDSSIPMPKVTPVHEEDLELARSIEHVLSNEIRQLKLYLLNDIQERTCPIQGGDFFHVEWDHKKGFHCNLGGISISERHPRQVIPQPGCVDVDKMDYIFVQTAMTKDSVRRRYGVDVSDAGEQAPEIRNNPDVTAVTDIVTVNTAYYRNDDDGIGMFVWCDDYVLEDYEDYQSRRQEVCTKCGKPKTADVCECGNDKFAWKNLDEEELQRDIVLHDGTIIPSHTPIMQTAFVNEDGTDVFEEVDEVTKIPYYKPNVFPLIMRKNVSRDGKMLGFSDADVIKDQQDVIKKLGSKINEKVLTGGSVVTLPNGKKVELTDGELKVVRVRDAYEKALIGTVNLQIDPAIDRVVLNDNYEHARSTLGITDSFQGKYDASATSGTAKQYSINQAAGRLESKRVLKNDAYAKMYEIMFKFMLAYSDQKVPYSYQNKDGEFAFEHFDRYQFLRQDASGEFYWDDEFIFETDPTSTMLMNREAMWAQADLKLQSGAFGPLGDANAMYRYWKFLEANNYPNASVMRKQFEEEVQQQKEQMAQIQALTQMQQQPQLPQNAPTDVPPIDLSGTDITDEPMADNEAVDPFLASNLLGGGY